jgi:succinoglycan biosynthesis transport protein ExoP
VSNHAAPLAERVHDLPPPEMESGSQSPNFLFTIVRRWPLVLLGVLGGVILGLAYYAQASPVYESKAQVLVIKRSGGMFSGGDTMRFSYMEDYVSTQQTLIKSKKVMGAAARRIEGVRLQHDLPEDMTQRTEALVGSITVSRDKDAASIGGSNVLNLAFRSGDSSDCKRILETIITAYQEELKTVYDQQTTEEINVVNTYISRLETNRTNLREQQRKARELMTQTLKGEDFKELGIRLAQRMQTRDSADNLLDRVSYQLNRMKNVPNDPIQKRIMVNEIQSALQLTGFSIIDTDNLNSPQNVKLAYELDLQKMLVRFGDQHPQVVDLKTKIEFLNRKIKEMVGDSTQAIDNFAVLMKRLTEDRDYLEIRKKTLDGEITDINTKLSSANNLDITIKNIEQEVDGSTRELQFQKEKLAKLEATRNSGGYNAATISDPSDGLKVAPRLIQSLAMFTFLGTLFGFGLALAFEMTDKSFRSPAEIRKRLGLPVVGHIPPIRIDLPMDNPALKGIEPDIEPVVVSHLRPKSIEAEAYRGVRTQLYFSTQGAGHQVIQVTSPNPGDGKSTLAANLAVSIAQSGKRVVLMDCDFRKPRVHKIFHIEKPDVGLASVISGDTDLAAAIRTSVVENLFILPCGPRPQNPAELLTSPEFQDVIDKLRAQFDFVIIDTPPVLAVSDPAVVAPRVDGVLLVFRMTKKARPTAERAREQLAALGANVLGVIVNGTGGNKDDGYGYGYGYNYGYGYQYQYQYEYEYADNYTDDGSDTPSSYGELEKPVLPPSKD